MALSNRSSWERDSIGEVRDRVESRRSGRVRLRHSGLHFQVSNPNVAMYCSSCCRFWQVPVTVFLSNTRRPESSRKPGCNGERSTPGAGLRCPWYRRTCLARRGLALRLPLAHRRTGGCCFSTSHTCACPEPFVSRATFGFGTSGWRWRDECPFPARHHHGSGGCARRLWNPDALGYESLGPGCLPGGGARRSVVLGGGNGCPAVPAAMEVCPHRLGVAGSLRTDPVGNRAYRIPGRNVELGLELE